MKGLASALLVWGLLFGGFAEATTTTLNPADKAVNATLSNGNLTITTTPAAYSAARSTTSHTSGKWYFEVTINSLGGTNAISPGFANATETLGNVPGSDSNGSGWSRFDTSFRAQNAQAVLNIGMSAGTVIGVAIDFTNKNAWMIGSNNIWNQVATSDPATNTKGLSCASGCVYPGYYNTLLNGSSNIFVFMAVYNGSQATMNFGGSAFSRTIPVGFVSWDGAQGSTVCSSTSVSAGPC